MRRVTRLGAAATVVAAAIGGPAAGVSAHQPQSDRHLHRHEITHVLLISVDGLHQSDLEWYVANHPGSELAKLAAGGPSTPTPRRAVPSDSDPGGTALMTGGDPRATGVYYDVEYNHALYEAGTTSCHGQARPAATSSTTRPTTST